MKLPEIEDLLLKVGLYDKFEMNEENFSYLRKLCYREIRIDTYCPKCKKGSTFYSEAILVSESLDFNVESSELIKINISEEAPTREKLYNRIINKGIIYRSFKCSRDYTHLLQFIFMVERFNNIDTILKIGQYPSSADLNKANVRKYTKILNNILSEEKSKEFSQSIMLHSHGFSIASFVYLRRIFEELVFNTYRENKDKIESSEENFNSMRMREQIILLKSYLPSFMVNNKHIYSILSKGIHELEEKECNNMYDILKAAIEIILEERHEMIEKEKKLIDVEKSLNKLNS